MDGMRSCLTLSLVLAGCFHHRGLAVDNAVLGRVVIYRNGVAFYEKHATVIDGKLAVHVPRERVDDFLKSLTVLDPTTREPLAVTIPRTQGSDGYLTMMLDSGDARRADVLLTYVTEAAAWKPSYRVAVKPGGKVMLEGWAIVDNVSGEDWKRVQVGVGSSSALSFRYDLWSVRRVDRDLLQGDDRFAIAPPTGVSPYAVEEEVVALDQEYLKNIPVPGRTFEAALGSAAGSQNDGMGTSFSGGTSLENQYVVDGINTTGRTYQQVPSSPSDGTITGYATDSRSGDHLAGVTVVVTDGRGKSKTAFTDERGSYKLAVEPGAYSVVFYYGDAKIEQRANVGSGAESTVSIKLDQGSGHGKGERLEIKGQAPVIDAGVQKQGITLDNGRDNRLRDAAKKIVAGNRDVLIEAHGADPQSVTARSIVVRDQLVDAGVPAQRIHVVRRVAAGEPERVRLLAVAPGAKTSAPPLARAGMPDTPVGESRFMAERPLTVPAGASAMVAMVHGETTGGVAYLYDPISERGDARFAFKAVRLDNPTGDALETGPVTVYGDGRFIGEGITEPVPPHASVVVPFALDRQIVVERTGHDDDRIATLRTAQRGIVTAELQHRRTTTFAITSRLAEPTIVYLRHRLESGWSLVDAPSQPMRVGDSQLFAVDLAPGATRTVAIVEATPVERKMSLDSDEALGLMQVYVDEPEASPQLKAQLAAMLATHRAAVDLGDRIATLRDQLGEYRARAGELHAQLVTLKAVRTGGELMSALRRKLAEISEHAQKTTLAIVEAQEKLMLSRVKFQNQLAELHLEDVTAKR
jgi:hypothetical protein